MNDRQHERPRDGRRGEVELSRADDLTAMLWRLAVLLAVLLVAYWLVAATYS